MGDGGTLKINLFLSEYPTNGNMLVDNPNMEQQKPAAPLERHLMGGSKLFHLWDGNSGSNGAQLRLNGVSWGGVTCGEAEWRFVDVASAALKWEI